MSPDLVERVAKDLVAVWTRADDPQESRFFLMARYALALAERAADEAVSAYRRGEAGVLAVAVERAVEGGA